MDGAACGGHGIGAAIYFGVIGRVNLMAMWAILPSWRSCRGWLPRARAGLITLATLGILAHLAFAAVIALTLVLTLIGGSSGSLINELLTLAWPAWAIVMLVCAIVGSLDQEIVPRDKSLCFNVFFPPHGLGPRLLLLVAVDRTFGGGAGDDGRSDVQLPTGQLIGCLCAFDGGERFAHIG